MQLSVVMVSDLGEANWRGSRSLMTSAVQLTMLERAGHSRVAASDGRMALFDEGDFGLLFPDIFMPGMDGFETVRLVHQQRRRNRTAPTSAGRGAGNVASGP
jgi:CheY-like chemotaxis protein